MQRPSLRGSTIVSVTLIGLLFILLSILAGNYFRQAALNAQTTSLSRIIEVASFEALRNLQRHAINLGTSINTRNNLSQALRAWPHNRADEHIAGILDDPFVTGFVGISDVELVKIRVYDLALKPLVQSRLGIEGLPFKLPPSMHALAQQRQGVERLKALGELWVSPSHGPLYSTLLPIGGLRIEGYIEAVFDPRFTLRTVSEMAGMPITILLPGESPASPRHKSGEEVLLPITYSLIGDDGQVSYQMIGMENIDKLNQDMLQTQWLTVIGFFTVIFITLLLALWLLRIGLFTPLRNLLRGIEAYSQGDLDTTIQPGGLREIHTLGSTFNEMVQRIRDYIRELERFSTIDGLTDIPNRRYFDHCMEQELGHAKRQQTPLSLLYLDIDHFKRYNDRYGHLAGDETLRRVAQTIASLARRNTDVAARLGGEEFVILLPDTDREQASQLAEHLQQAIRALAIEHADSTVGEHLTLSIGSATLTPERDTQAGELLGLADRALYQAKAQGRNRVVVAD
ncbi:MAG: diguanylate cyclase [Gammaproteobacteria bacterium]|nr:diguanylate cyclase [Gammaproteobacteria bacterium]